MTLLCLLKLASLPWGLDEGAEALYMGPGLPSAANIKSINLSSSVPLRVTSCKSARKYPQLRLTS